jgi:hypothetical protein
MLKIIKNYTIDDIRASIRYLLDKAVESELNEHSARERFRPE